MSRSLQTAPYSYTATPYKDSCEQGLRLWLQLLVLMLLWADLVPSAAEARQLAHLLPVALVRLGVAVDARAHGVVVGAQCLLQRGQLALRVPGAHMQLAGQAAEHAAILTSASTAAKSPTRA
jgi:hypothetical protein